MVVARRCLLALLVVALLAVAPAASAGPGAVGGRLTGTWSGYIVGHSDGGVTREHIVIIVNGHETGGSWKLSATCQGPLRLENISNGYHHFLRKLAPGSSCAGGDVDCLKRVGANVYDAVTSRLGGAWGADGTLRRVR